MADQIAKLQTDRAVGEVTNLSRLTLGAYLLQWLEHNHKLFAGRDGRALRLNTYRNYERIIRLHINPAIGGIAVRSLEPAHLKALYREMLEKKELSVRMAEIAHRLLHVALEAAVDEDRLLPRNPCDALKDKPRTKYNPQDRPVLSREEAQGALQTVKGTPYYLPFLLAMTTGMRRAEIVALRWQNVDLQEGVIHVREQIQPDEHRKLTLQPVKTESSNRDIPLPSDLVATLQRHRGSLKVVSLDGYICTNRKGKPLRPDDLDHAWRRVRERLGLPASLKFHDLRHSFTNWQAEAGPDVKTVSTILGHSDERVTLSVYRSVTEKMRREAARAMEGLASSVED